MIFLSKELTVECPCCNEKLTITMNDENLKAIRKNELEISESELNDIVKKSGIEFG